MLSKMSAFGAKFTVFKAKRSKIWQLKTALAAKAAKFLEMVFCFV
jgi:hypothetical protein